MSNRDSITYIILKFESKIKKPVAANHTFFAAVTFSKINSSPYINAIVIQQNPQKDFHQDNLSFVCF